MKKILIFEIWHVSPQLETGLELAELHAEKGDDVTYVNIGGHLPYVEWYDVPQEPAKRTFYKASVAKKIAKARGLVNREIRLSTDVRLTKSKIDTLYEELRFSDIEELKNYTWKGMDLGMAAASSYITDTNDLSPDTIANSAKINQILHSSRMVAESFTGWLDAVKPDLVYFRNGRVSNYRPILRVCQQRSQPFLIHDRACDKDHYSLGPIYRHDWEMRKRESKELWNTTSVPNKEEIGRQFFEERRKRADDSYIVFAGNQREGLLPESWDKSNYNIVYFNSSIAEYAAVGDEVNPHILYKSQEESLRDIERILGYRPNAKLYLRLHPNLLNMSDSEKEIWMNMQSPGLEVIRPDSPVDTYSLINNADLVICYLSTVGIEAAYAGTPVIILGRALYEDLDVAYSPKSKDELKDLLLAERLEPKPVENTLEYGFYMKTHGIRYKYFEAIDHRSGTYKGLNFQRYDFTKNYRKYAYYKRRIKEILLPNKSTVK